MMTELRAAGEKFLRKLYEIGKIITKSQPLGSNQKTYTRYFHYPKYDVILGEGGGGGVMNKKTPP